jgi:hypothetical protein
MMNKLSDHLLYLKLQFEESKLLLSKIDLILEAQKQLALTVKDVVKDVVNDKEVKDSYDNQYEYDEEREDNRNHDQNHDHDHSYNYNNNKNHAHNHNHNQNSYSLEIQLNQVQEEINLIEKVQEAHNFLMKVSIPSVASSPAFTSSLRLLLSNNLNCHVLTPQIIQKVTHLQGKCWDNAILIMEKVLEKDLISIEVYLDDEIYKEIRDKVLKEIIKTVLINPKMFHNLIIHFIKSYCKLRENYVTFVLDTRLNNQFINLPPLHQLLHLIERTRLLFLVESKEFKEIFPFLPSTSNFHLNKILETVGNLLFKRIEIPSKKLN